MTHQQVQLQSLYEADNFSEFFPYLSPLLNEIRLLEVLSDADPSSMAFKWRVTSLSDINCVPLYTALSYTWDGIGNPQRISVDGRLLVVQETVYQFLKHNARSKHASLLFIDAVCINQSNNNEKNHQVRLMSKIYNFARDVVMWFWPVETENVNGLKTLLEDKRMNYLGDPMVPSSRKEQGWRAALRREYSPILHDLHTIRYWKRIWIVQEVVLARSVRLWYGLLSLTWEQLVALVGIAESGLAWNTVTMQSLWNVTGLRTSTLQSSNQGSLPRAELSIVEISYRLVGQQCEDPRDRIYGVLGLVNDLEMDVDYSLSLVQLYEKVSHFWLEHREAGYNVTTSSSWRVEGRDRWRCICWLQLYLQGLQLDSPDTPETNDIALQFIEVTTTFLSRLGPMPVDAAALEPPQKLRWSWNHRLKINSKIAQILRRCSRYAAKQVAKTDSNDT